MPTIFEIFGLRFFFYSDEHLPIHVHIEYGGNDAKVEIATRKVVQNRGLKPRELKKATQLIRCTSRRLSRLGTIISTKSKTLFNYGEDY